MTRNPVSVLESLRAKVIQYIIERADLKLPCPDPAHDLRCCGRCSAKADGAEEVLQIIENEIRDLTRQTRQERVRRLE